MGRNTVNIRTTAPLPYLLITVKVIALEKVSLSDIQNSKTVCLHIHCRRPAFSEFFFAFLKFILNFKHFPKKDDPHS